MCKSISVSVSIDFHIHSQTSHLPRKSDHLISLGSFLTLTESPRLDSVSDTNPVSY